MITVLRMDIEMGIVMVLNTPMRAYTGLNMGSPASAGGASLTAAYKEEVYLRSLAPRIRRELEDRVLIFRWADDLIYVCRVDSKNKFRRIISDLTEKRFYGAKLLLVQTYKNAAFGFRVTLGTQVEFRSNLTFIGDLEDKLDANVWVGSHSTVHGGQQFQSPMVENGIIKGHLLRPLVSAGRSQTQREDAVTRVACELLEARYRPKTVMRVALSVMRQECLDSSRCRKVLESTIESRNQWTQMCDLCERRARTCETALIASFIWRDE